MNPFAKFLLFAALCLGLSPLPALADLTADLQGCARLTDDRERLSCYDRLAGSDLDSGLEAGTELVVLPAAAAIEAAPPALRDEAVSLLTRRWELDESRPRGRFTLMMHRDNYLLPVTYNHNYYEPAESEEYTVEEVKDTEAKYQISIKTKLWQDILGSRADLWFGYTQQSYWQIYNVDESAPFRETNYEPELLLNYRADLGLGLGGLRLRTLTAALNHQSNGRSEPMSRGWNRVIGQAGLESGPLTLLLKGWYRIPESRSDDDNRDIDDYFGPGELQAYYLKEKHRFGMLLRNNFQSENRTSVQLEWSYPILDNVGIYVQYFNGYGENLLDYDQRANRIGLGFILTDWN
ncbi:MAG: phospholipase A [Trichloromonas sp.]|nr:phospholipase A [Trichloromonas sp.]